MQYRKTVKGPLGKRLMKGRRQGWYVGSFDVKTVSREEKRQ